MTMQKIILFVFSFMLFSCTKNGKIEHAVAPQSLDDCQEFSLFCDEDFDDLPESYIEDSGEDEEELEKE